MAEREIPGGTSNGGSTARSLTLSVLIWAGIILALFATAGLSGYFSMKRAVRGGEVAVPPLEGKPLSEASSTLARVGLVLEKSGERSDDRFASGKILAQDPPAGVKLKRNRKVRVVVSLKRTLHGNGSMTRSRASFRDSRSSPTVFRCGTR